MSYQSDRYATAEVAALLGISYGRMTRIFDHHRSSAGCDRYLYPVSQRRYGVRATRHSRPQGATKLHAPH